MEIIIKKSYNVIYWIFVFRILSLIIEVYLRWKLLISPFFVCGKPWKIVSVSNTYLPHCTYIHTYIHTCERLKKLWWLDEHSKRPVYTTALALYYIVYCCQPYYHVFPKLTFWTIKPKKTKTYIYSISHKWVHPSHFCKYFIISFHVTTLKKWHFATM